MYIYIYVHIYIYIIIIIIYIRTKTSDDFLWEMTQRRLVKSVAKWMMRRLGLGLDTGVPSHCNRDCRFGEGW